MTPTGQQNIYVLESDRHVDAYTVLLDAFISCALLFSDLAALIIMTATYYRKDESPQGILDNLIRRRRQPRLRQQCAHFKFNLVVIIHVALVRYLTKPILVG